MCELGFFPIFLEKDLLKVDKILGLMINSGTSFSVYRSSYQNFQIQYF